MAKGRPPYDHTGRRYGLLVATERAGTHVTIGGQTKPLWRCQCDCGKETVVIGANLRSGMTQSCGCNRIFKQSASMLRVCKEAREGRVAD